jgi:hypothetical protein
MAAKNNEIVGNFSGVTIILNIIPNNPAIKIQGANTNSILSFFSDCCAMDSTSPKYKTPSLLKRGSIKPPVHGKPHIMD